MSTWLAFASVFLPDNEEPAPTTQADKHEAPTTKSAHEHAIAQKPIPCHRLSLQLRDTLYTLPLEISRSIKARALYPNRDRSLKQKMQKI